MAIELLAFFSSDARELYKADVYRALALPPGYVIHFRYKRDYISRNVLPDVTKFAGREGVIIFVAGNAHPATENPPPLSFHSIRKVKVKEVIEDLNIATFHFYLELGDFADLAPHRQADAAEMPPNTFVSKLMFDEGPRKGWSERVDDISRFFPNLMFLTIDGVFQGKKRIPPGYDTLTSTSLYSLAEESSYACRVTFLNPGGSSTGLQVTNSGDAVELIVPPDHRLGALRDTTVFEIHTHTLSRSRMICVSYLMDRLGEFGGEVRPDAWRIELKWQASRGRGRAIQFGLLSVLAAAGIALAKFATDRPLTLSQFTEWNFLAGLGAILAIGASASLLFSSFNKK